MREYGLCLERTLKRERERFRWRHWYQLLAWEESINSFLQSPSPVRHELLIILKYLILTCLELVVFIMLLRLPLVRRVKFNSPSLECFLMIKIFRYVSRIALKIFVFEMKEVNRK